VAPGTVPVGYPPPGYGRGQPPLPGHLQAPIQPPKQGTSTGLIVAIIVAVVLVAVCVGAAIAILQQQQANANALGPAGIMVAVDPAHTGNGHSGDEHSGNRQRGNGTTEGELRR
jgi:hypothetical protein